MPGAPVFSVEEIHARWVLMRDDECQHLLVANEGCTLQLRVSGASLLQPVHLLCDALLPPRAFAPRMLLLRRLGALQAAGRLRSSLDPPDPRSRRLSLVLAALDLRCAGASDREIAVALFGRERVEADWSDPGEHLRDRVRRAVRRGRALMNGGYRRLLV